MSNLSISGKTVAISGAAMGFGRAIAALFASEGARVFGCDILDAPADGLAVTMSKVDLLDRGAAAAWIREVEAASGGAIDILVCNAGGVAGQGPRPLEEVSDGDWDKVIEINLGTTFSLSRAAVAGMKKAGSGVIVTIASGAALQASLTGIQAYCSAKHAVLGLTRQLAHELGPFGIRVNSIAPGFVLSNPSTQRQWDGYATDKQEAIINGVALKRLGSAQEIAKATLFLASDLASFVNGQVLSVDGGR